MSSDITVKENNLANFVYGHIQSHNSLPTESRPRLLISNLTMPNSSFSRINRFGEWPVEFSSSVSHSGEFTLLHNCNEV